MRRLLSESMLNSSLPKHSASEPWQAEVVADGIQLNWLLSPLASTVDDEMMRAVMNKEETMRRIEELAIVVVFEVLPSPIIYIVQCTNVRNSRQNLVGSLF